MKLLRRIRVRIPEYLLVVISDIKCFLLNPLGQPYPFHGKNTLTPVFIMGPGRSGNTLLVRELSNKLNIHFPPEIPGLGGLINEYSIYRRGSWYNLVEKVIVRFKIKCNVDIVVENQPPYNLWKELRIDEQKILRHLKDVKVQDRNLSYVIHTIYMSYFESRGIDTAKDGFMWGDKTPWSLYHYLKIYKTFPRAHYIFTMRNPMSIVSSYLQVFSKSKGLKIDDAILRWKTASKLVGRYSKKDRAMMVKYEDFVKNPDNVLLQISRFLGLNASQPLVENLLDSVPDSKLLHHSGLKYKVNTNSLELWKAYLTKSQQNKIVRKLNKEMLEFNYNEQEV